VLTSPWVAGFGSLAGIAALITGVYFYLASEKYRSLTFYVQPVKSVVVSKEQLSDLRVFYRDRQVEDVTIAQIAVWNQGNDSIKMGNVLDEVRIVIQPAKPILRVAIIKTSRPVIAFVCDEGRLEKGVVPLSWKILEQGDGALVQLVYAGAPDAQVALEGTIEGQRKIAQVRYGRKILTAAEQMKREGNQVLSLIATSSFLIAISVYGLAINARNPRLPLIMWIAFPISILSALTILGFNLYEYIKTPSPFGF
jgi:hypothetical protein